MPIIIKQNYFFTGPIVVNIYTEQEMADALGVSRDDLRAAIGRGQLSYHAHPLATGGEYQFLRQSYVDNQAKWKCLQDGGHHFEFDHYYDKKAGLVAWKCRDCPAEKYD